MIRYALILTLLAAPALAQTAPVPRPEGLGQNRTAVDQVAPVPGDRAAVAVQITGAIRDCWNVGDLSEEAMAVRIRVAFEATPEGELIRETIEMTEFSNGTQEAADEALGPAFRAIMRCGEVGLDLPPETYSIWQRVEVLFDASTMVTR